MPDDYNNFRAEEIKHKQEEWQKIFKLHDSYFNPAKLKKKEKFENPFAEEGEIYIYPFLGQDDPYDATRDEILRTKWVEDAKIMFGEFKPTGP